MRRRIWVLVAALASAVVLGFIGRATQAEAWHVLAGLGYVVALAAAVSLLPWHRVLPRLPPMPGLFQAPAEGERWCTVCGSPAPADQACGVCGTPS